jgi:peptide chain release factor 2
LEKQTHDPKLWENPERAQKLLKKLSEKKEIIEEWKDYDKELEDISVLVDLSKEDSSNDLLKELNTSSQELLNQIKSLELRGIMSAPEDSKDAILTIHPGAGGTESQDWAEMLMRMYMRWADKNEFKSEILDLLRGGRDKKCHN